MQCFHARNAAGTAKYTHENRSFLKFRYKVAVQRSLQGEEVVFPSVAAATRSEGSVSCPLLRCHGTMVRVCGVFAQMTVCRSELDRIHFHTRALSLEEAVWTLLNIADSPMTSDTPRVCDQQTHRWCPWGGLCPVFMDQWWRLAFMRLFQPASRGRQALLGVTSPVSYLSTR